MIKEKCTDCIHRVNAYCKAYKYPIKQMDVEKCKRKKVRK